MKEPRSIESWRSVSVCPSPPKITSWWATRPGRRTEWIGSWTLPPAAAISSAVRFAVPEGASSFLSWCSSTISHSGMWGAIRCAASISSTAPIAKLGATKQLASPRLGRLAQLVEVEAGGADHRVDARPRGRPRTLAERGLRGGEVDDDVGVAEHARRARPRAPDRPSPASSMSSAPSTASQTACPIRPAAPETTTRITPLSQRSR